MSEFSAWRYESDGGLGARAVAPRTHYAVRDNAAEPCGVERLDFNTAQAAREFVRRSNALVFRVLNRRSP